jgi:hypothetical protein
VAVLLLLPDTFHCHWSTQHHPPFFGHSTPSITSHYHHFPTPSIITICHPTLHHLFRSHCLIPSTVSTAHLLCYPTPSIVSTSTRHHSPLIFKTCFRSQNKFIKHFFVFSLLITKIVFNLLPKQFLKLKLLYQTVFHNKKELNQTGPKSG